MSRIERTHERMCLYIPMIRFTHIHEPRIPYSNLVLHSRISHTHMSRITHTHTHMRNVTYVIQPQNISESYYT